MAAQVPVNDNDHQVVESTAENLVIIRLPLKSNNVQVLLDPATYQADYRVLIEFLQHHPLNKALTLANPNIPEQYIQEVWQTLHIDSETQQMVGSFGHPIDTDNAVAIPFTKKKFARYFGLPQPEIEAEGEIVPNPDLAEYPSTEALLAFIHHLGYNEELTILSQFKRKKIPPMWNVLVSILNRSLTCKTTSMDQANRNILTIMYGMYFNLNIDYVSLIYNEFRTAVVKKCQTQDAGNTLTHLCYPRFLSLFTQSAVRALEAPIIQPLCKIFTMNSHKPTVDPAGYPFQRELSRYMLNLIPSTLPYLNSYRSSVVYSEPRIPTQSI